MHLKVWHLQPTELRAADLSDVLDPHGGNRWDEEEYMPGEGEPRETGSNYGGVEEGLNEVRVERSYDFELVLISVKDNP